MKFYHLLIRKILTSFAKLYHKNINHMSSV